jgi:hypothetical protein
LTCSNSSANLDSFSKDLSNFFSIAPYSFYLDLPYKSSFSFNNLFSLSNYLFFC